jgi:glucan phosphoethanolaminetransferase (alkaline phosphatase superfamily)
VRELQAEDRNPVNGRKYLWLIPALLIFLIPDLIYLFLSTEESLMEKWMLGFISVSIALILPVLFARNLKLYSILILILSLAFGIISTGIVIFYKSRMNVNTMGAILNTHWKEASEFLSGYEFITAMILLILFGLFILIILNIPKRLPRIISRKLFLAAIALFITGSIWFTLGKGESIRLFLKSNLYKNYYPVYCFKSLSMYYREELRVKENVKKAALIRFNAVRNSKIPVRSLHVLIIGESGRYENWTVNGYQRPTSPRMMNMQNLVSYSDAISSHNETVRSVALTVTNAGARKALHHSAYPGILKLFREAGYRTYWISNQNDWGALPVRVHMTEADSIHCTISSKGVTDEYDGTLLPIIRNSLNGKEDKFLIIHLTANHWSYEKRYPTEFAVFGNINEKSKLGYFDKRRKQELIDIYDNSVLYQDYIISEIVRMLDNTNSVYTMTYIPDHGENLFDDCRNLTGHGTNFTSASFRIPMFICYSDSFAKYYPGKKDALILHKQLPFVVGENLFQSVADIADLQFENSDPVKSIASENYKPLDKRPILLPDLKVVFYEDEVEKEKIEIMKCAGK